MNEKPDLLERLQEKIKQTAKQAESDYRAQKIAEYKRIALYTACGGLILWLLLRSR